MIRFAGSIVASAADDDTAAAVVDEDAATFFLYQANDIIVSFQFNEYQFINIQTKIHTLCSA